MQEPKKEGPSTPTSCLSADPAAAAVILTALSPCHPPAGGVSCSLRLGGGPLSWGVSLHKLLLLWVISVTLCQPAGGSTGSLLSPTLQGVGGDWGVDGVWRQLAEPCSKARCVRSRGHVLFPLPPLEGLGAPSDFSVPRVCTAPSSHRAGRAVVLGVRGAVSWHCRARAPLQAGPSCLACSER